MRIKLFENYRITGKEDEVEYAVYFDSDIFNIPGFSGLNQEQFESFLSEYFGVDFTDKILEFDPDVMFLSEPVEVFEWDRPAYTHQLIMQRMSVFRPERKKSIAVMDQIGLLNPEDLLEDEREWIKNYRAVGNREVADKFDEFGFFEIKRFTQL